MKFLDLLLFDDKQIFVQIGQNQTNNDTSTGIINTNSLPEVEKLKYEHQIALLEKDKESLIKQNLQNMEMIENLKSMLKLMQNQNSSIS